MGGVRAYAGAIWSWRGNNRAYFRRNRAVKAKTRNIACKACGREYDRAVFRACPKCADRRTRWRATTRSAVKRAMARESAVADKIAAESANPVRVIAY